SDKATRKFRRRRSGFALIDEIGKAEQIGFGIVNGDGEIARAHEFVNDAVGGGEKLLKILRGAGFLRDAIKSGAKSFGAFALRDVAIDGIEGGDFAIESQRAGRDENIEQGAVFAVALSFESDVLAALQTLRNPFGFGG